MSNQLTLYSLRHSLGLSRQPRHSSELEELNELLTTLVPPQAHPYELEEPHYTALQEKMAYAVGGRGLFATCPDGDFLFRLSSVRSVVDNVDGLTLSGIPKTDGDDTLWTAFNDGAIPDYEWKPLSRYVEGHLTGYRKITWWTGLELTQHEVVKSAFKMGRYSINIPVYALLLRCKTDHLRASGAIFVPTVLDAFDQEVFHPTKDDETPESGQTISLEHAGTVAVGVDEFVCTAIPVDQISFMPILIDATKRQGHRPVERGDDGWKLLESYYSAL
jgi:hypothetical protein